MNKIEGIPDELQDAAWALYVADVDYQDFQGSPRVGEEYLARVRQAQKNYREAKAAYEARQKTSV